MGVQSHQIVEVSCPIGPLDTCAVMAFLSPADNEDAAAEGASPEVLESRIETMLPALRAVLEPRGVYKLFNPATCTLPPSYTEPGIKLVGTMAVLRGEAVYDRMRRATHCAIMATAVGDEDVVGSLRAQLVHDEFDQMAFDACLRAIEAYSEDHVCNAVRDEAVRLGLHIDEPLQAGDADFPLESNTQLLFYTQAERRLGVTCEKTGRITSAGAHLGVIGMYDASQKNRKRACARCRNRGKCSIRAIGMNCHGRRGSFKK